MLKLIHGTGATGLVGSRLVASLTSSGHTVRVLSRNINSAKRKLPYGKTEFFGPQQWPDAVRGADAVVNLAGSETLLRRIFRSCAIDISHCSLAHAKHSL